MSARFRGRREVARLKQRLDESFDRVSSIDPNALELRADFARYLCVLVAGYLEQSVRELAREWSRNQAGPSVARYADKQIRFFQNAKRERLLQFVGSFDASWRAQLESDFNPELHAADSVVENRHSIAHGESVGMSYDWIRDYYESVERLVQQLVTYFDP